MTGASLRLSDNGPEEQRGQVRLSELENALPVEWAMAYAALGFEIMPRLEVRGRLIDALKGSPRTGLLGELEVRGYWSDHPRTSSLAVVCGHISSVFVLDIDQHPGGPDGLAELRRLEMEHDRLPPTSFVLSPSNAGRHVYFAWPRGYQLKNGPIAPGLEILGDRMAATLPPSTKGGRSYRWSLSRHPDYLPIADPPEWLVRMARPLEPQRPWLRIRLRLGGRERYARATLEREVDAVANAQPGQRNATLNRAAWSLARLDELDQRTIEDALMDAARWAKLSEIEARSTIRSGLRRRGR